MSKNFIQTLAEINAGTFEQECASALTHLISQIRKTGGKGSITVKLNLKPSKGNQTVSVDPEVHTKVPEFERASDFFFMGQDDSLVRDHPEQRKLPLLEVVDRITGEIKEVAGS